MARKSKCFRVMAHSHVAARALGCPGHVVQVEVIGWFPTKKAFAQALVEVDLFRTEVQALSEMRRAGGETWNQQSIETTSAAPGQVFVGKLNASSRDTYMAWPPSAFRED